MLCISISFVGCGDGIKDTFYVTKSEATPTELGKTEGFYVYKGNTRCLTDGTNKETILTEIIVNGETYKAYEFEVIVCSYMRKVHEIFYILSLKKEDREPRYSLYHYNYDTKESGCLYILEESGKLTVSDDYAFWQGSEKGILINSNVQILSDELNGFSLDENILYKWEDKTFFWWMDGRLQSIALEKQIRVRHSNGFAYFMQKDKIMIVNLTSGVVTNHNFDCEKIEIGGDGASNMRIGDAYYVVTKSEQNEWRIWRVRNDKVADLGDIIVEDGEIIDVSIFQCNDEFVNFSVRYQSEKYNSTLYTNIAYYVDTGEIKSCGSIIQYENPIEITVGEYRFYVESFRWGEIAWNSNYGYYLRRVKNGKDDIMQYYFDDEKNYDVSFSYYYYYFDDIYSR